MKSADKGDELKVVHPSWEHQIEMRVWAALDDAVSVMNSNAAGNNDSRTHHIKSLQELIDGFRDKKREDEYRKKGYTSIHWSFVPDHDGEVRFRTECRPPLPSEDDLASQPMRIRLKPGESVTARILGTETGRVPASRKTTKARGGEGDGKPPKRRRGHPDMKGHRDCGEN